MKRRTERRKREREQLPPSLLVLQQLLPPSVDPRRYLEQHYGRHASSATTSGIHEAEGIEAAVDAASPASHHTDDVIAGKGLKRLLADMNALPPLPHVLSEIQRRREEEEQAIAAKKKRKTIANQTEDKGEDEAGTTTEMMDQPNTSPHNPPPPHHHKHSNSNDDDDDDNTNTNTNHMEERYHFTGEDLWRITKRVPRSRSTPDHLDIAELCFALHQASCPVEIHARRQTEGSGATNVNGAEGEGIDGATDRGGGGGADGVGRRLTGGALAEDCPLLRYYKGRRFADLMDTHHPSPRDENEEHADVEQEEWVAFVASLSTPLPMTLRVHKNEKVLEAIARDYLRYSDGENTVATADRDDQHQHHLSRFRRVIKPVPFVQPRLNAVGAAPASSSFSPCLAPFHAVDLFGCPHHDYHADKQVEYMCRTLHSANAVSFQEVVSALPALVLDVQPHHRVIDMCAAPGSKTLHVLDEMLAGGWSSAACKGVLIASEKDRVKATQTLPARLKRYHAPNVLCVRCDGTQWPRLYHQPFYQTSSSSSSSSSATTTSSSNNGDPSASFASSWEEMRFDRVICDVPCSGDGTVRKEPSISMTWSAGYVKSLVPTQIALLRRAVELLAVDGVLVYSTCSMNPKEDEEVVCAVLEQLQEGEVEMVDVNAVLRDKGVHLHSCGGLRAPEVEGRPAPAAYDGSKVLRVFPHRDNTGGFFVAALRKRSLPDLTPPANVARKLNQWTKGKLWAPVPPDDEQWRTILSFYGLEQAACFAYAVPAWESSSSASSGEKRLKLVTATGEAVVAAATADTDAGTQLVPAFQLNPNGGPPRRIVLVTLGLAEMLFCTRPYKGPGVEVVSAGVRAFEQYDKKFLPDAQCRWRATVEALSFLSTQCVRRRVALLAAPAVSSSHAVSAPSSSESDHTMLEGLLRHGHVWLSECWPAVLLSRGDACGKASLSVNRSLVVPDSPLERLLESVVKGETTVERATAQMMMGSFPHPVDSAPTPESRCDASSSSSSSSLPPSSSAAPSGLLLLDGLLVGGVVVEVRRRHPDGMKGHHEHQYEKPWCLSATLSRSKLEVAVDGSLRAFGLMHFCNVFTPIATGDGSSPE